MPTNTKEAQARYNAKRAKKREEERKLKEQTEKQLKKEQTKNEAEEHAAEKIKNYMNAKSWKNGKTKARAWAFIVYPESAPENWKDILQKTGLPIAISPLHDSDKDPTEEDKKPHWHIIIQWGNTTTGQAVKRITDSVNAPIPIPINGVRGYYRYFTHKDNPEKFQYDEKEIQTLNKFNIADIVELTRSEVDEIKRNLQIFIIERNIIEYCDLMDYLLQEDLTSEYSIASSNTYFFDKYISSRRNKQKENPIQTESPGNIDPQTGEILP